MSADKPIILSGIQPTNQITLGNYLGALKNWVKLQHSHRCFFAAVDLHSIVTRKGAENLCENTWYALASYIAAGLDPEQCCLFVQSHVPQHTELAWILNCFTYMGELSRMTQFKDKSAKEGANIPAGLFNYPVLMASDILLYQPKLVPVGEDQRQHLEMTRNLAQRLNNLYKSELFTVPEPYIPQIGAKIMDLRDPRNKMSKSAGNDEGSVFMGDNKDTIRKKIKRATTDSGTDIIYDPEHKPGVSNLLTIQAVILEQPVEKICARYVSRGYGDLKSDTADLVIDALQGIQSKTTDLLTNRDALAQIIASGAERATVAAEHTLQRVRNAIGFLPSRV